MESFKRRSSKGASLVSVYRLETGLVQNAPSASLNPELWMLLHGQVIAVGNYLSVQKGICESEKLFRFA